jgi:hypothetical protein
VKLLKDLVSHDTFPCVCFLHSLVVKNASCNRSKLIVACSSLPHFFISRAIKKGLCFCTLSKAGESGYELKGTYSYSVEIPTRCNLVIEFIIPKFY